MTPKIEGHPPSPDVEEPVVQESPPDLLAGSSAYLVVEEDNAILGRGKVGNAGVRGQRLIAFELDESFIRAYREGL